MVAAGDVATLIVGGTDAAALLETGKYEPLLLPTGTTATLLEMGTDETTLLEAPATGQVV